MLSFLVRHGMEQSTKSQSGLALPNLQSIVSENDRKSHYVKWNKCHLGEIN